MSQFDYIARAYGKRFKRGQEVIALGKPGRVTSADHYVYVCLHNGPKHPLPHHPDDVTPLIEMVDPDDANELQESA
jgi:hypothetical protein